MKLLDLPDGAVDEGERASWLTPPFDLALASGTPSTLPLAAASVSQSGYTGGVTQTGYSSSVN